MPTLVGTVWVVQLSAQFCTMERVVPSLALAGRTSTVIHFRPPDQVGTRLRIVKKPPGTGCTECRFANHEPTAHSGACPTRNPWFSGDVAEIRGDLISFANTSQSPARATAFYSGGIYFVPGTDLGPICHATLDVQVPPVTSTGSRNGNSQLGLKTWGGEETTVKTNS